MEPDPMYLRAMPVSPTEFTIRPNSACNDGSWRWLFALLAAVSLAIALRFALLGFWLILPFTVVEIAGLALGLWWMLTRAAWVEKVRIDDQAVEIRHLEKGRNRTWRFPLGRTRVQIRDPARRWYPHRLILGCAGEWVEIGHCLTDEERCSLAAALRAALERRLDPATR